MSSKWSILIPKHQWTRWCWCCQSIFLNEVELHEDFLFEIEFQGVRRLTRSRIWERQPSLLQDNLPSFSEFIRVLYCSSEISSAITHYYSSPKLKAFCWFWSWCLSKIYQPEQTFCFPREVVSGYLRHWRCFRDTSTASGKSTTHQWFTISREAFSQ